MFEVFLCLLLTFSRRAAADPPAYRYSHEFASGKLGIFPELKFESTDLKGPQVNLAKWGPQCDTDQYYFMAPRGMMVGPAGPTIMNTDGHMVWHREDFGVSYGLTVQRYKGEDVLTFWSGDDMVVGHGSGYFYMFDKHYRQIHKVSALGGLTGDLHEFKITKDGTALLTAYEKVPAHLGYFGRRDRQEGWIFDCVFQEINIETNTLLFEWRATSYFKFEDCFNELRDAGTESNPFDYYHLNSVDKDNKGNYIVSARYSHAITYIDGRTGEVLWHLGGKQNSFKDLSEGLATNFAWQHDARWQDDYTAISVFDNAAYFGDSSKPARGLKIAIDQNAMTARLLNEWVHPDNYVAESQGSLQLLDNGNALLGYGSAPVHTEFSADGAVLCDVHFGALYYKKNGEFSPMAVMSYRVYKHSWKGLPWQDPKVKFKHGHLYISWNGATEVRSWGLESSDGLSWTRGRASWQIVDKVPWAGFESNITVNEGQKPQYNSDHFVYRLSALDSEDKLLGVWIVDSDGSVQSETVVGSMAEADESGISFLTIALVAVLVTVVLAKRREMKSWATTAHISMFGGREDHVKPPLLGYDIEGTHSFYGSSKCSRK